MSTMRTPSSHVYDCVSARDSAVQNRTSSDGCRPGRWHRCLEEEGHQSAEDGASVAAAQQLQSDALRKTGARRSKWNTRLSVRLPETRVQHCFKTECKRSLYFFPPLDRFGGKRLSGTRTIRAPSSLAVFLRREPRCWSSQLQLKCLDMWNTINPWQPRMRRRLRIWNASSVPTCER